MHKTISKAFGDNPDVYKRARCMFRVEDSKDLSSPVVLVQSLERPDWKKLTVGQDYFISEPNVKEFSPIFRQGQRLAFRLKANPTVKRKREGEQKSKREGLYKENDHLAWLARKAEASGFKLISVVPKPANKLEFGSGDEKKAFCEVTFDGQLVVVDPEKMAKAVMSGVGPAKAFGFGLLSVALI